METDNANSGEVSCVSVWKPVVMGDTEYILCTQPRLFATSSFFIPYYRHVKCCVPMPLCAVSNLCFSLKNMQFMLEVRVSTRQLLGPRSFILQQGFFGICFLIFQAFILYLRLVKHTLKRRRTHAVICQRDQPV